MRRRLSTKADGSFPCRRRTHAPMSAAARFATARRGGGRKGAPLRERDGLENGGAGTATGFER